MKTTPPAPLSPPRTLPAGQTETHFNSAFVQVGKFVFNPTLVSGFLHRDSTEQSVPVTEVMYGSHHLSVEDEGEALFFYLCHHTNPQNGSAKT